MNLALLIARRFRKSREKTRYLSFISASSTLGIGLACAILIILLSVMNGFQKALETDFLSMVPHVEYQAVEGGLQDWRGLVRVAEAHEGVKAAAPAIRLSAMVQQPGRFRGLELRAIETELEPKVSGITRYVSAEDWQDFANTPDGILLGQGLAEALQLYIGDSVSVIIPQLQQGNALRAPQRINLQVAGIFAMGGELDFQQAYIHLATGQAAARIDTEASTVRLALHNVYDAPEVARDVAGSIREYAYIHDWTRTEGHLYRDIQLVRTIMYLVLVLVLAVASFNIVSTLIMVVREKQASIAILRTMGAAPSLILKTFVLQGSLNGVVGAFFGSLMGAILAALLPSLLLWLEQTLSFSLLPAELYFISSIPSDVALRDVLLVGGVALATSVLATLYPAWQAAKLTPVQALRGQ
ncbi:lipoprotein-releasing system transmembrane subunit, LolC/LolE family [Aliidiomarina iranensis]|uniref:Lipoprotein-releasing system transmembrane subunit, LolC/LolE family n=1 Tax=Aliidiomarina iranensis TaxID=1434071 RepID=A0A432W0N3_9GAMM|nr:lipoprotein-releasing ABC transporter permease subunit [Aliidiomarina iranensis]RUO22579.1 lipoprotein-releasing system transmembrane subunit, LolC/LolE family [Aliidiomarina iranensis]